MLRYLVLGLLRGGSAHGYALMKQHEARSGLRISTGSFYRELGRLLAEGLVCATHNDPDADPRRTPYAITPAGKAAFDSWFVRRPREPGNSEDELAARAVFFPEAEPEVAREMLRQWAETLWLRSKMLERQRKAVLGDDAPTDSFSTSALLISRRLAHVGMDIDFLEKLSNLYEEWLAARAKAKAATPAKVPERRRAGRR